jgi:hypothetical protein
MAAEGFLASLFWYRWKPLPYSPLGTHDTLPDGFRNHAVKRFLKPL